MSSDSMPLHISTTEFLFVFWGAGKVVCFCFFISAATTSALRQREKMQLENAGRGSGAEHSFKSTQRPPANSSRHDVMDELT